MSTGFYELEVERLLSENAELWASNARWREALEYYADIGKWGYASEMRECATELLPIERHGWELAKCAILETPAQSLEAIRAEERTKCVDILYGLLIQSNKPHTLQDGIEAIWARGDGGEAKS
jgi:hypothetical protein